MSGKLWRITAPRFVAGLIVVGGVVRDTAPILRWASGLRWAEAKRRMVGRGWHGEPVGAGGASR